MLTIKNLKNMKTNLRLLCLGLAAMTFTAGFAQAENVTSKLRNADMEEGVRGWSVDGEGNIFGKNTKIGRPGFHGVSNMVLENWKSDASTGLTDNSISQTVRNLPAGTYVFGAYVAASLQGTDESNRDVVTGVSLFANEATVSVATDNPDKGHLYKWAHTGKFNVPVTVAEGGDLHVGLTVKATNANYVVWDNATLYYFGNMSEADALNEMAKIDMAATVAIADTCFAHKMNVDSLKLLTETKAAAQAIATADQLWQLNEDLYWAIRLANNSAADYRGFYSTIAHAEEVANMEWSAQQTPGVVEALNELIASAKAIYDVAAAVRAELSEQEAALNEAAALVALDSCYVRMETLMEKVEELEVGDEVGQYSKDKIDNMDDILWQVNVTLDGASGGELSAIEAQSLCDSLFGAWQLVYDSPNSEDAFPFTVGEADGTIATIVDGRHEFTSRTYTMPYPVSNLRFTFMDNHNTNGAKGDRSGFPAVSIAEFYVYDGDGNEIELSEQNFFTNAQETSEGPMKNICDDDKGSWWHSTWSSKVTDYHYLEVSLPEGLDLTSFSFGWVTRYTEQVVPKTVVVTSISNAESDLQSAIASAKTVNAYRGTAPGFYNADLSSFYNAIAAAEALVGTEASEEEIYDAIGVMETEMGRIDEMQMNLPVAGKQYRLINANRTAFNVYNVEYVLTTKLDTTTHVNMLQWEIAHPDSAAQLFTFEAIANKDGALYYKVKNASTGLYVGTPTDEDGEYQNTAALFAASDTVTLTPVGAGKFTLNNHGLINTLGFNWSGNPKSGTICKWNDANDLASQWYICEMETLPLTALVEGASYTSPTYFLYEGVDYLTITADKVTDFDNFAIHGVDGKPIADVSASLVAPGVMSVELSAPVCIFSFSFDNKEGVAQVTVSSNNLSPLSRAYEAAVAWAPEQGTEVMQYADLTEYNIAVAAAEKILTSGGSDEEILAAIAALEAAVAGLTPNAPDPDKTYFIVSALDAFEENHGVKMMMYASATGTPRWMYENVDNANRLWKFELDTDVEEGTPAMYYIKNVATGGYFGDGAGALVDDRDGAISYAITQLQGTVVALDGNGESSKRLHANQHGGGAGKGSNIVYWSSGLGTASAWRICESEKYINDLDDSIEAEECIDEFVAPAKKGIFDLFGRRIDTPAATGIYIVDGKKRVIKK